MHTTRTNMQEIKLDGRGESATATGHRLPVTPAESANEAVQITPKRNASTTRVVPTQFHKKAPYKKLSLKLHLYLLIYFVHT